MLWSVIASYKEMSRISTKHGSIAIQTQDCHRVWQKTFVFACRNTFQNNLRNLCWNIINVCDISHHQYHPSNCLSHSISMYIIYLYVYVCTCICTYVRIYVYMSVCVYLCKYVYLYMYICMDVSNYQFR